VKGCRSQNPAGRRQPGPQNLILARGQVPGTKLRLRLIEAPFAYPTLRLRTDSDNVQVNATFMDARCKHR
jgi:hypothetical protein